MKYIALLFSLIYSIQGIASPQSIEGKIVFTDGTPVKNTLLHLVEPQISVTTNELGTFSLSKLKPGSYTIQLHLSSGLVVVERVAFSNDKNTNVILDKPDIERIVVTASLTQRSALDMSIPVNVLSNEELVSKRGSTIGETLADEPGISASPYGAGASRPVIRGLSGNRVRALQNGIGTLDASSTSPDHAISSEPLLAQQIEVLKGPITLLYGSEAIGGVINVVDGRIPNQSSIEPLNGSAEIRYNSGNNEKAGVARLDGGTGMVAYHVSGYFRDSGDQSLPSSLNGDLLNSDVDANGATAGISLFDGKEGYFGVAIGKYANNYGLPAESKLEEFIRLDIEQNRTDIEGKLYSPFNGIKSIHLKWGKNDYQHVELEGEEIGTVFSNDADESRLEIMHEAVSGWQGALGIQFNNRDFSAQGEEAFVPPSTTKSTGIFWVEEKRFGEIKIEWGLRHDTQTVTSSAILEEMETKSFSTSIGALWRLNPSYSFALALSRAQRPPNAEELLSNGPHLATQTYELGNINLAKETANNIDISLRKHLGKLNFTINGFYNKYDDFIYERATGEIEDELPIFQFEQKDASFKGIEIDSDWLLFENGLDKISVQGQVDYVRATLSNGENLPRIPPIRFGVGALYETTNWFVDVTARRYFNQNKTAPFETSTDGYTLVDVKFNYQLSSGFFDYTFFIRGQNLLDEVVRNHASFIKDIAPLQGRSITAGVRAAF
ncbi:iron complex outermembrane recepter protein [Colwellia chukchiensis]|uniref:Iron complex outermembrane recepter protein n=1 Tax=Colwellia chukchiensis TaxID=641665 RepID=A0A1H7UDK7_9GAMM|nr:TonB-dependent receptor [Colwellia chukchiensis]SEL94886.1 iron complex outermembrane recepter protein [Colwellia chukchiensis]